MVAPETPAGCRFGERNFPGLPTQSHTDIQAGKSSETSPYQDTCYGRYGVNQVSYAQSERNSG